MSKKKNKLVKKVAPLQEVTLPVEEVTTLEHQVQALNEEVSELQCRIAKITDSLTEAFDRDGVNDIDLPTNKVSIWLWALTNAGTITRLIQKWIDILKEENPCGVEQPA
jgi:hypothetical protein